MCNCNKKSSPQQFQSSVQNNSVAGNNRRRKQQAPRTSQSAPPPQAQPLAVPQALEIEGDTLADKCRTFGYMLGLDQPVSETVLIAAVEEPGYARSLMAATNKPERLNDLLHHPPRLQSKVATNHYTTRKLLTKASSALMKWALNGFPTVPKATLRTREDACLACPNLTAPTNTLQQITASAAPRTELGRRTGNKSCAVCGCVITNKIRLATETCPVEDPARPGVNLWGEAVPAS